MAKFFIIALTVMLVMLGYVSWHVWRVLPFSTAVKAVVIVLMFAALACMVMQFKSDSLPLAVATAMYEIGNSWLIIMFYLLMALSLSQEPGTRCTSRPMSSSRKAIRR